MDIPRYGEVTINSKEYFMFYELYRKAMCLDPDDPVSILEVKEQAKKIGERRSLVRKQRERI
jgi:hypothetical protein